MPSQANSPYRNQLLCALSREDRAALVPHLERRDFPIREVFERPNRSIPYAYFIESGFASVVAADRENGIEVGLIGREGMSGLPIIMGTDRSPHSTYAQLAGSGYRIEAGVLREKIGRSATLRALLLNFAHIFMVQATQTALVNGRAAIGARLARWILMGHDRINGDALILTHEFLAVMLGVRRAGVTEALHILKRRGLIRADRRNITIVDRAGLEATAGRSYGIPEAEYRRLFG